MPDIREWLGIIGTKITREEIAELRRLYAEAKKPIPSDPRSIHRAAWVLANDKLTIVARSALPCLLDIAERQASDARGWQPIAEAPPDTLLWTLWDGMNRRTNEPARHYHAAALQDGEWIDDQGEAIDTPTHWRLLPAPPADEAK